jgi:hypothetical protein
VEARQTDRRIVVDQATTNTFSCISCQTTCKSRQFITALALSFLFFQTLQETDTELHSYKTLEFNTAAAIIVWISRCSILWLWHSKSKRCVGGGARLPSPFLPLQPYAHPHPKPHEPLRIATFYITEVHLTNGFL